MRDGHTGEGAPDAACGEQGATPGVFTLQVTSHLHFREDTCRRKQPWKVWRSGEMCSAVSARWQVVVKALDSGRLPVRVCLSRGGGGGGRPEPWGALLWEAEGKQSSDPASKEAPGDAERPRKRTISESHHHCQVGRESKLDPPTEWSLDHGWRSGYQRPQDYGMFSGTF